MRVDVVVSGNRCHSNNTIAVAAAARTRNCHTKLSQEKTFFKKIAVFSYLSPFQCVGYRRTDLSLPFFWPFLCRTSVPHCSVVHKKRVRWHDDTRMTGMPPLLLSPLLCVNPIQFPDFLPLLQRKGLMETETK